MTWLENCRAHIRTQMADMPADATLPQRRKRLREIGWQVHGNTYWGRKQWGKAAREYLELHGQAPRYRKVEDSPNFGPDIIFPFRDGASK